MSPSRRAAALATAALAALLGVAAVAVPSYAVAAAKPVRFTVVLNTASGKVSTGATVKFSARGTHAAAGRHLTKFTFDAGDHTRPATGSHLPATLTHRWGKAGRYRVVLTVVDDKKHKAAVALTLTVVAPKPAGGGATVPTAPATTAPATTTPPTPAPSTSPTTTPATCNPAPDNVPGPPSQPAGTYKGVVWGQGGPVAGVTVTLVNPTPQVNPLGFSVYYNERSTTTAADGTFSFSSPGSTDDMVFVNSTVPPGLTAAPAPNVHWTAAHDTVAGTRVFVIALAGTVTGHVVDSSGTALSGVNVQALRNDANAGSTTTDTNGAYTLNQLAYGTYTIDAYMAVPHGQATAKTTVTLDCQHQDLQLAGLTPVSP